MREPILAFSQTDEDNYAERCVSNVKNLVGSSLEDFVINQAERGRGICIRSADGSCGLTGETCTRTYSGEIETSMGGYIPGPVNEIRVEISCDNTNCPSDHPAQLLAGQLNAFSRLAGGASEKVSSEAHSILAASSKKAEEIIAPAEQRAEETILEPARRAAAQILDEAVARAEEYLGPIRQEAADIEAQAQAQVDDIRATAIDDVLAHAQAQVELRKTRDNPLF